MKEDSGSAFCRMDVIWKEDEIERRMRQSDMSHRITGGLEG